MPTSCSFDRAERETVPERAFILFDDCRQAPHRALLFEHPGDWITCRRPGDIGDALARIEAARRAGFYCAGYVSYELGYALEPRLAGLMPDCLERPLLVMGVFRAPRSLAGAAIDAWFTTHQLGDCTLGAVAPSWDLAAYRRAYRQVQEFIGAGDVYQINLTFPLTLAVTGCPVALFRRLRRIARAGEGALMAAADETVLSLSPELFIAVEGDTIRTRPMKGTCRREPDAEEDAAAARMLADDEKQRAENLMIVDLLRNDLGRVARIGSVRVDDLYTVETYPTLHTMTSGISARLQGAADVATLLHALFPCGSVTGAPKVRAMEIIAGLEQAPRGVYCGAMGWLAPGGDARFNVAIRTLTVRDGVGRMGVGSGVVHDSDAEREYEECLLKARFLTADAEPFALIETLAWEAGRFVLLERHIARLSSSAAYFRYPCDVAAVRAALAAAVAGLDGGRWRVRLLLDEVGGIETSRAALPETPPASWTFVLSAQPTASRDAFFRHKTTRRSLYDGEHTRLAADTGCDEVLFTNERGELTEGSRSNLFIERDGILLTPPLACGVLAGCLRTELLAGQAPVVREAVLRPADLAAGAVWLGNSVQGLVRARLIGPAPSDQTLKRNSMISPSATT